MMLGDFQTPPALAREMLDALHARGIRPRRILEPTCGRGAFLIAASERYPDAGDILGIEYQADRYGAELRAAAARDPRIRVRFADAYRIDAAALEWRCAGPLLVVGNPPWITAAALGRAATGAPQPQRRADPALRGLAARTGAANFDVADALTRALLESLAAEPFVLAFLVKEAAARKTLAAAEALGLPVETAEIVRVDARRWFGVGVDACALIVCCVPGARGAVVHVRRGFEGPATTFALRALGAEPAVPSGPWRQGIKHDAAAVFELVRDARGWRNGAGEHVDVEDAFLHPYCKARALHAGEAAAGALIVPQHRLGAPTAGLRANAPRLHAYLERHAARLAARRSSIYRTAPPFAVFGVGPYSFAPWKVAVAGFYALPRFRVLGPHAGRPVVVGDTAYFVPFADETSARAFAASCASEDVTAAIARAVQRGKRPITKALLDSVARLDPGGRLLAPPREHAPQ